MNSDNIETQVQESQDDDAIFAFVERYETDMEIYSEFG
jgi:hypothetical protein